LESARRTLFSRGANAGRSMRPEMIVSAGVR
jgi:hypothetical protein